ncbi:MAG: tRNA (guanosine(46)-N7)-methyltransferase TrmB [Gammaproteobacteria bacterium]|nr:tRNA (guanosine(46)-N7)-methyltransferase TrmB [Gammaproteobacteria bacterium]MCB1878712.1 tRNA (guanosine(46)-N7)-methyltransferase TrmB [Gammaproteobacteria bacterium]
MSDVKPPIRRIRSFVLREGRLTQGQQRAFEQIWPYFGVPFEGTPLDLPKLFGNCNPVYLEIGFGDGESLAQMATVNPEYNYLGVEVHRPGVGHLLLKIEQQSLTNLYVIRHDAVEILSQGLTDASLAGIYLFFPDPWHKRRHNKRRILQPTFVGEIARVLRPGGIFHTATDWKEYACEMMRTMTAADVWFENCAGDGRFSPRPDYRLLTKFEQRGVRLGHGVWDLIFRRR